MRSNKDDNDSYSDGMTDVSNTNLNFSCGNMLVVTDSYHYFFAVVHSLTR